MRTLRLGLLGTGIAARKLYWPALSSMRDKVRLVACANRTRSKAEAFAFETGIPKVVANADALFTLPDVDAVLISLPIATQPKYVLQALKAGKAVLSEKPLAPNLVAGRRLIAQARPYLQSGSIWMVAENYRFMPAADWAEAQLADGAVGDLRLVEIRQSGWMDADNPYYHTTWRRQARFVGGFVFDAGVHLAHLVRRMLGQALEIHGLRAGFNPALRPMDTALAVLRFRGGALGTWLSSFACDAGGPMLVFRGSAATLELNRNHAVLIPRIGSKRHFKSSKDSYALQFEHFAEAVTENKKPCYSPNDALEDLAFMESVVRGRVVKP